MIGDRCESFIICAYELPMACLDEPIKVQAPMIPDSTHHLHACQQPGRSVIGGEELHGWRHFNEPLSWSAYGTFDRCRSHLIRERCFYSKGRVSAAEVGPFLVLPSFGQDC